MDKIEFSHGQFKFNDVRLDVRDGIKLYSTEDDVMEFMTVDDLRRFLDYYYEVMLNFFRGNKDRECYGTIMCMYKDDGNVMIWYDKREVRMEMSKVRCTYRFLKAITRKWEKYCKGGEWCLDEGFYALR